MISKSKHINKAKVPTIASCKITEILAREGEEEVFEDSNVIKECIVVAGNSLSGKGKAIPVTGREGP
jgi:hypothetical protein